jgi:hypothetical protein
MCCTFCCTPICNWYISLSDGAGCPPYDITEFAYNIFCCTWTYCFCGSNIELRKTYCFTFLEMIDIGINCPCKTLKDIINCPCNFIKEQQEFKLKMQREQNDHELKLNKLQKAPVSANIERE